MIIYDLESVSLLSAGKIGKHFSDLAIFLLDNFAIFFGSLQGLLFRFRNSIFEINFLYAVLNLTQLQAGAEFFPRAISCTQATQTDSINSIASAG